MVARQEAAADLGEVIVDEMSRGIANLGGKLEEVDRVGPEVKTPARVVGCRSRIDQTMDVDPNSIIAAKDCACLFDLFSSNKLDHKSRRGVDVAELEVGGLNAVAQGRPSVAHGVSPGLRNDPASPNRFCGRYAGGVRVSTIQVAWLACPREECSRLAIGRSRSRIIGARNFVTENSCRLIRSEGTNGTASEAPDFDL